MKYISFCPFILCLIVSNFAFGQNLVPNPSFEEYLECPLSTAEFQTQVVDWYSFSGSPDYFNTCNSDGLGTAGVPDNAWGFQYPVTGNAYAGVITFVHYLENDREYIACPIAQLNIGTSYYIMFYISNSDDGPFVDWRCATDHFGLKFFKDPAYDNNQNQYTPQNSADLEFNEMFSDTTNWHLVEGWFTADQAYNYIALGNFYDDANTDTLQLGSPDNEMNECAAIYYVDNVCISEDPADCQYLVSSRNEEIEIEIYIYPNPSNGNFTIESGDRKIKNISVYNLTGELVFQKKVQNRRLEKIILDRWASGMYLLKVELDDGLFYQTKLIKE